MIHQPKLDGFRGLCVLAVFLFHAQFLARGWIGVQAFFVLSGYLITAVLLEGKERAATAGGYFRVFYARRALRIFPVYFAYIGVVVALVPLVMPAMAGAIRAHSGEHVPWLATYTYNFFRVGDGLGSPFYGHLWSLSIEEQFYLAWPLCVLWLDRGNLARLCLALLFAGPLVRLLEASLSANSAHTVYFLTPSHFDAFAAGALLNLRSVHRWAERITRIPLRWAVLAVLSTSAALVFAAIANGARPTAFGWPIYLPDFHASVWGYTLLNWACLILLVNIEALPLAGHAFMRRLGRVSYGFYIFHLPILWWLYRASGAERGTWSARNVIVTLAAFAATWVVAETSFRFVELPFLRMKPRVSKQKPPATLATESVD